VAEEATQESKLIELAWSCLHDPVSFVKIAYPLQLATHFALLR
jgi:hypothetical protein